MVLFDEYGYRTFNGVSGHTPEKFRVTEFAFNCDKLINLPVLKTHYLTTVTLAMKNLKGSLKREDKPLFHHHDLSMAVVELNKLVRPTFNVIDCTAPAIVHQLGSGYMAEQQTSHGFLIAGSDIVAVDAVGSALMGIDPAQVRTVSLGAACGLGESELLRIEIIGEEIKQLKFRVKLPQEQLQESFPLLEIVGAEKACSGCLIPVISELLRIRQLDVELGKPLILFLGEEPQLPRDRAWLAIGECAQIRGNDENNWVPGCPPDRKKLFDRLTHHIAG
jgi:hypothetical protein